MEVMSLNATLRTTSGKTGAKATRKENRVPCVLYGGNEVQHFSLAPLDLRTLVYTPQFKIVEINLEGKAHRCILKNVQYHPVTDQIYHMDFLRLIEDHPIKIEIPVSFEGVAIGIKSGGKLIKKMRKVKIKTMPEHLIDKVVLDTTNMALGTTQRIKDLIISDKIEILNTEDIPGASIEIPRAVRTADEVTPAAGAPAAAAATTPAAKGAAPAKAAAPSKAAAPAKDAGKDKKK
jgi:large subunit ribosomal protein L25